MRIIIDGDACPKGVRTICEKTAAAYNLPLLMVADISHNLEGDDDCEVISVDEGPDSSDYKIASMAEPQDIIITHDYGLAALVLDKATAVLNPMGFVYSNANIDQLLYQRFLRQKERKAGHGTRIKKRTSEDDALFKRMLMSFVAPVSLEPSAEDA